MLFLGHIGINAFLASMIFLPVLAFVIGGELPDVVDKGLFVLGNEFNLFVYPCSRLIAHTFYFPIMAGLVAFLITRDKKIALAVGLGSAMHLVEDLHDFIPFFYPFVKYDFASLCGDHIKVVFDQYIITTELIGVAFLIFVFGFKEKFSQFRKAFWKLFKRG